MDMQNVAKLEIPEGEVRTIHDKNGDLLWGKVSYSVKYSGNTVQNGTPTPDAPVAVQTVTGENVVKISDGQGNEQSYEVNLGKNLFDVQDATGTRGNNTVVASSQTITLNSSTSGTETSFYLNDVSQIGRYLATSASAARDYKITGFGGSYTLRITLANIPSGRGPLVWCAFTNKRILQYTRSDISDSKITKTITLSDDEYFKSVQFYTADTNVFSGFTMTVQLEKGSTATSYAAYFTPIELCNIPGTDYRDKFIPRDGKWYVHKAVEKEVFVGSENWTLATTKQNTQVFRLTITESDLTTTRYYSNRFKYPFPSGQDAPGLVLLQTEAYMALEKTTASTVDGLKTWLGSNNTTLYYVPTTPTDTEITNEALIEQLEEINEWITRYGYSYQVTGNLPIIIDRTSL